MVVSENCHLRTLNTGSDSIMAGTNDYTFMRLALDQAREAADKGEVPVGSIIVYQGEVISSAGNSPISSCDPTAHAETTVIRRAAKKLGAYRIPGAELFVTLEPCMMCFGAMLHARISRLVYGASDPKVGFSKQYEYLRSQARFNHDLEIVDGILADESSALLKCFFAERR